MSDCNERLLIPLSDAVIYCHLASEHTIGVYPLLKDDNCCFFAIDFDTSIECVHQRFADFLKISVEEVLITIRHPGKRH